MNILKYFFSAACFSTALAFVIYWCLKYSHDEDLVVVDYKNLAEEQDDVYPMLGLCFSNVIIESELKKYNEAFTVQNYTNYLKGDDYFDGMEQVDFETVTLNFPDYLLGDTIWYKNRSEGYHPKLSYTPQITYSGFFGHLFLFKCYGIKMNNKYMWQRFVGFNSSIFPDGKRPDFDFRIHLMINGKFVLSENTIKDSWPVGKNVTTMRFVINQMEILRRRNKRKEPCIPDELDYDKETLRQHLEKLNCRAPYQTNQKQFPICQSKKKMKDADYFNKPKVKACTSLQGVIYRYEEVNLVYKNIQSPYWLGMKLPTSFKEIQMVRAVNIQTVVGNSGGYVGLFLGNKLYFTCCSS